MQHTNELIHESSPYLLQHAHNPVNWYPWGEKALEKAKQENKPILVSIGYAACHWCHVMERESFSDAGIAEYMNEHFVNIKVDREERPDVDMIYMNAAQLISGSGGWPLNALALPDGRPFFAATYFPPARWMQLLQYFVNEFSTNKFALTEQAEHLSKGVAQLDRVPVKDEADDFTQDNLEVVKNGILRQTDAKNGGLASNIKFPMPSVWRWLLEYHSATGDEQSLQAVKLTLRNMLRGGIYDQVGGGFARYSTDALWHVPHFEKMLYDNVQMVTLCSEAYQVVGDEELKETVRETIGFMKRELSVDHGFFTALDADSEGEEGKFYVWTKEEIEQALGEDAPLLISAYGVTDSGNWEEGKNIPSRGLGSWEQLSQEQKLALAKSREVLLKIREERVRPALDDKVITSWNAMACVSLLKAGFALGDSEYINEGNEHLRFILDCLFDKKESILYRNFKGMKRSTPGFLDDYAFLIQGAIELYQATFDRALIGQAEELTHLVFEHFSDPESNLFFYNDRRFHKLITRPVEMNDSVIPASNSVMAENLLTLGLLLDKEEWAQRGEAMVKDMKEDILKHPAHNANWARVMMRLVSSPVEVAIVGDDFRKRLDELHRHYLPFAIICGSEKEENLPLLLNRYRPGETLIYVCRNKSCLQPVHTVEEALSQMKKV